MIGLAYTLVELKNRIHARNPLAFVEPDGEGEYLGESQRGNRGDSRGAPSNGLARDFPPPDDCRNLRELKQRGLLILAMIDRVKEKLLQLDILEARLRELILSLEKAMEAFCHEARIIRREIYPFGVFSRLRRGVRVLWGRAYFTLRDMERISDLGIMTSHVLKIADSPIM